MFRRCNTLKLSQQKIKEYVTYDEGQLYTKQGLAINGDSIITFHIEGKRYYIKDIVYVYVNGPIPEGKQVGFIDGNEYNLKSSNLCLL